MGKRFPYGSPTGWFQVARADDLAPGQVLPLRYFGKDLALFRTQDGNAHLLDAFCPHLGAHLGHGGKVVRERLVCPFHGWEFEGSGRCAHVPYATLQPRRAEVGAWRLIERCGLLLAWHDRAGREPSYEIPAVPEHGHAEWTFQGILDWRIRTSVQEMSENQIDSAHFRYVHAAPQMPETVAERHGPHLRAHTKIAVSTPAGVMQGRVEVNSHGLGFTTIRLKGLFETLIVGCPTAIDDEHIHLRLAFTVRDVGETTTRHIGDAFKSAVQQQLSEDIPIWENKIYVERPLLVDGDGPIGTFRSWARQFYPELATVTASP